MCLSGLACVNGIVSASPINPKAGDMTMHFGIVCSQ